MPTTLCTMRTLQVRETMTILKVDFPVDARIRPFVPPTRKRDSASLSSNRRRPLDTPTSPGDQTSGFLMRCKTMPHAMLMHSRPIVQSSDHAVPEYRIVEPHVSPCPSVKKAVAKKALGAGERDRDT